MARKRASVVGCYRHLIIESLRDLARRLAHDRRGNIAAMVALMAVPLVATLGIATETSGWFLVQRAMQNAADSAVLAAATSGGTTYAGEAQAMTAKYGFINGANNTTVTPSTVTSATETSCPVGSTCYKVSVSRNVPLYLMGIVGYAGTSGSGVQTIYASAIAGPHVTTTTYCALALGTSGNGIKFNGGGGGANFNNCNLASNSTSTSQTGNNRATICNGHSVGAATLTVLTGAYADSDCATNTSHSATPVSDAYAALATNNASDLSAACDATNPPASSWSTNRTLPARYTVCGNLTLGGNVNITSVSPGSVLIIRNGQLILNSYTLKTLAGSGLTIVFSHTSGTNIVPFPSSDTGKLDIVAPTSGNWSGTAIYQTGYSSVISETYSGGTGSNVTWYLTGLIYLPKVDLTFQGNIRTSTNGLSCLSLVVSTLQIGGNSGIYANSQSQCAAAGLTPPTGSGGIREVLVQ
jgi:Flp pilus assembly protein TadG